MCDLLQGLNYLLSVFSSGKRQFLHDIIVLFYVDFQHQLVSSTSTNLSQGRNSLQVLGGISWNPGSGRQLGASQMRHWSVFTVPHLPSPLGFSLCTYAPFFSLAVKTSCGFHPREANLTLSDLVQISNTIPCLLRLRLAAHPGPIVSDQESKFWGADSDSGFGVLSSTV